MSQPVIELDKVSKKYRLRRGWYVTSLRDEAARLSARLLGRSGPPRKEFWALKDVSFELKQGETFGLVGANGAGKSTLLKILSKVTVPTSGSFKIRGRVGALIEVGAGFHPELTGRENVYLNGAIMGMRRKEILAKFDRIVDFAEIEQFIDTPIKFYSSGMQMRLGFAVAAHTDPDILLVDEVLGVGDASFQAKCLNKLAELKEQAKTIILVSHSLSNIREHSKTALWIDHGTVKMIGDPNKVVDAYLNYATHTLRAEAAPKELRDGSGQAARILDVTVKDDKERLRPHYDTGEPVSLDISFSVKEPLPGAVFGVSFQDVHGYPLGGITSDPDSVKLLAPVEQGVVRLTLRPMLFTKGRYTINVWVGDPTFKKYYAFKLGAATFVVDGAQAAHSASNGYIQYPHQWECSYEETQS